MSIRCASKAIILHDGRVLLNRCRRKNGSVYYDLPGGGQHPYESMEEALAREVREETGYQAEVVRFAALVEEIHTDPALREAYPDYTHRVMHLFIARLKNTPPEAPSEKDLEMEGCQWIPVEEADALPEILPAPLTHSFRRILAAEVPVYLGTVYMP